MSTIKRRAMKVVVKFDQDLILDFEFSADPESYDYIGCDRWDAQSRVKKMPDKNTLCFISPGYSMLNRLFKIDEIGQLNCYYDFGYKLNLPGGEAMIEYPPGSTTYHRVGNPEMKDWVYIPQINNASSRLVGVGKGFLSFTEFLGSIVISYEPDYQLIQPGIYYFNFKDYSFYALWIKEHWGLLFPVPPYPDWIPENKYERFKIEQYFSFSESWIPSSMPMYLKNSYKKIIPFIINSKKLEFPHMRMKDLVEHFKSVPENYRFSRDNKKIIIKKLNESIDNFEKYDVKEMNGTLLKSLNSIDLDWRVPTLLETTVEKGEKKHINLNGAVKIYFNKIDKTGNMVLKVNGNLPATSKSYTPGWPIVNYELNFDGSYDGVIEIQIYYGGLRFLNKSIRLLEWNGKGYQDITHNINHERRIISGKSNKLSTYVIMSKIQNTELQYEEKMKK